MSITEKLGKAGIPGFRSGKKWKMALAVFGYFWIFVIVLALLSPTPSPQKVAKTELAPTLTPVSTATPPIQITIQTTMPTGTKTAIPIVTWKEVARWEGQAIKNTETFSISSREWRISWDTKPGEYGDMNFQIYIYKADGNLVSVAANVIGANKDSSIMRGAGDYYLSINTAQPYTIIVEEKQ